MRLRTSFRREAAPEDLAHLHEVLSAAGACGDAGKTAQDDRAIYQPFQLMGRKIILSDETLGAISQFEIFASRCDCTIGTSPLGPSLSRTLARMDGIFVALLNGARADYRTCCFLDYLKEAGGWTKGVPDKAKVEAIVGSPRLDQKVLEASRCAHQMMAIEINSLCGAAPTTITPRYVLALHQAISRTFHPGAPTGLRGWEVNDKDSEGLGRAYRPPSPLELPEFLQDLVMFLNNSKLGPSAKVALMHYQMEATKMFDTDIDQLARALLVGIWRNANLITHIMAPIAITPALAQRNHDEVLQPYQFCRGASETQMIDEWVYHTARASRNAFEVAQYSYSLACCAIESWGRALNGERRLTEMAKRFLISLIGSPVFSASTLAESIDTTFTTAAKLIDTAEKAGIIVQVSHGRRNKVYECPEATGFFNAIMAEVTQ